MGDEKGDGAKWAGLTCPRCETVSSYPIGRTTTCAGGACNLKVRPGGTDECDAIWSGPSDLSEPEAPAAPSGEGDTFTPEPIDSEVYAEGVRMLDRDGGEPDDIAAPAHYTTDHSAHGVEVGTELIDWIVAMRGREFAINAMIFEIQTKANRLGLGARAGMIAEDCFKLRQACRVVERLMEGE